MARPSVTVVMAAYEAEKWIAEALRSVLSQALPPGELEVVVVDDGSRDRTAAVAAATLADAGVAFEIVTQANAGPSVARNSGVAKSRGSWLQFLDADDLITEGKIASQLARARQSGTRVGSVFSEWARFTTQAGATVMPEPGDGDAVSLLAAGNFLPLASQLISREAFDAAGGFEPSRALVEDVWLMIRIVRAGFRLVPHRLGRPVYLYRQTPGSLSFGAATRLLAGMIANATRAEDLARAGGPLTATQAAVLSDVYHHAAYEASYLAPEAVGELVTRLERLGSPARGGVLFRGAAALLGMRRAHRVFGPLRRLRRH